LVISRFGDFVIGGVGRQITKSRDHQIAKRLERVYSQDRHLQDYARILPEAYAILRRIP